MRRKLREQLPREHQEQHHTLFEEDTVVSQNATEEPSHLTHGEGEEVLEDDAVALEEVVEPEELEDARAGHEHEDEFTDEVMGNSFSQDLFSSFLDPSQGSAGGR